MEKKQTYKLECAVNRVKTMAELFVKYSEKNGGNLGGISTESLKIVVQKLQESEDILHG